MNRAAFLAVVLICASSFACKSANVPPPAPPPPPAPAPLWPAGCVEVHGSPVTVPVNRLAAVPMNQECIVLDKNAEVRWQGDTANVKTLLIGWKPASSVCSAPPTLAPGCAATTCSVNSTTIPETTLPLCYGVGVIDKDGKGIFSDPRLIIRR